MRDDKITISYIAKSLGISSMSVSRALSNQAGVSQELRSKVIEKAKELNYIKNKKSEPLNILILHEKPLNDDNSNFSIRVQGIEKALQNSGAEYSLEFIDKSSQEKLFLPFKLSRDSNFDGAILLGKFTAKYCEFIHEKINNLIFSIGYSPSYCYDSVNYNFNNCGYKQCEYLIKNNHKNIGFLGDMSLFKNKEKLIGITSAMEDYNINANNNYFIDNKNNYKDNLINLLNNDTKITAVICETDSTALELIKFLYEIGIHVPTDISIIGSGNSEFSSLSIPSLTTMDLNIEYSCDVTVDLLIKRIQLPRKPSENISIYGNLIERDSVRKLD